MAVGVKWKPRPIRALYLYYRLMSQQLKALMSYQADFLISIAGMTLTQVLGLVFLSVVYQRIPDIHGWLFWEVAFIYAMVFFIEGITSFFFNGMWVIGGLINRGEMDRILVRPVSPVLQVFTSHLGIGGIGMILVGAAILYQSLQNIQIEWSLTQVFMLILLIISAAVIRVSIIFAACCQSFWSGSANSSFSHTIHSLSEFAKFPISIYSLGVQAVITVIVPFAFISFFPAAYLFGKEGWGTIGAWGPLVAVYTAAMALWIFYSGLKRYESAGN